MDQVKMKKIVIKLIALTASAILMAVDTKTLLILVVFILGEWEVSPFF